MGGIDFYPTTSSMGKMIDEKQLVSNVEVNDEEVNTKISASLPWSEVKKFESLAINSIGSEMKINGFRPGKIPANIVRQKVSNAFIEDRMAREAITEGYQILIRRHELRGVGQPEVNITRLQ